MTYIYVIHSPTGMLQTNHDLSKQTRICTLKPCVVQTWGASPNTHTMSTDEPPPPRLRRQRTMKHDTHKMSIDSIRPLMCPPPSSRSLPVPPDIRPVPRFLSSLSPTGVVKTDLRRTRTRNPRSPKVQTAEHHGPQWVHVGCIEATGHQDELRLEGLQGWDDHPLKGILVGAAPGAGRQRDVDGEARSCAGACLADVAGQGGSTKDTSERVCVGHSASAQTAVVWVCSRRAR